MPKRDPRVDAYVAKSRDFAKPILTSLADLPSDGVLSGYIKEAMRLNEAGVKVPKSPPKKKKTIPMPPVLQRALQKNAKAQAAFESFSPSHKYEYLEWITDAKTEETRQRRVDTAIQWMAEGKPRNWKYMKG